MKIIKPKTITETVLLSSNVPETDYAAWLIGTAYVVGNRVMYSHHNYEAILNNTGFQPDTNPLKWLDLGATNRYKMFDKSVSIPTTNPTSILVSLRPVAIITAVSVFNMTARTLRVRVIDDTDGVVYDRTINLQQPIGQSTWFNYFFDPFDQLADVTLLDLPVYGTSATIEVTLSVTSGTVKCGECIIGNQTGLGVSNFGTSISIRDYSRKTTDDFGNIMVVERTFSKLVDYDVTFDTAALDYIQRKLAEVRATPVVYIGDENRPETVVFGFYKNFNINMSSPSVSSGNINVESLP